MTLPFTGHLIDRFGSRFAILLADLTKALASIIVFLVYLSGHVPSALFLGLYGSITSLGNGQTILAIETLISHRFSGEELANRQSKFLRIDQFSMIIGPLFAIVLTYFLSLHNMLGLSAIFYLFNFFLIRQILKKQSEQQNHAEHIKFSLSFKNALKELKSKPVLLVFCLMAMCNNLLAGIVEAAAAGVVTGNFNLPDQYFSIITLSAGLAGAFALSIHPYLVRRFSLLNVSRFAYFVLALSSFSISFTKTFIGFSGLFALSIASTLFIGVYFRTKRGEIIAKQKLGQTVSIMTLINQSTLPIAGLMVAWAQSLQNPQSLCWIPGLGIFLFGFVIFFARAKQLIPVGATK